MICFDPYAIPPPREPWGYVVDDDPLRRASAGPRLLEPDSPPVRLAPDTRYRSWRNEYVLVTEEGGGADAPHGLRIQASLWIRARPEGADCLAFEAEVASPAEAAEIRLAAPSLHRPAALRKALKVIEWYLSEIRLRDAGLPPLLTAYELFVGEKIRRSS